MKKRKRQNKPQLKLTSVSDEVVVDLPEDIIFETLTCLPVKTIIKFRSVCKSWLSLFSNPKFIKTHLIKSSNNTSFTHHKLILNVISTSNVDKLHSCSLRVRSNNLSTDNHSFVPLDFPLKVPHDWVSVVGTCNGLVCLHIKIGKVRILIWNPSTRKSKELPWDKARSTIAMKFCFGYDQLNKDYKVLYIGDYNFTCRYQVKLYSLKNNSWGEIGSRPQGRILWNDWGKYVNGVLHWVTSNFDIISFDLGNDMFGKLSRPCHDDRIISQLVLGDFDGCLFASCHINESSSEKACIDIWVMKEYGISDSWVKFFTIPYTSNMHSGEDYYPVYIFSSGEILLESCRRLVIFNPNNHKFTYVKNANFLTNWKALRTTTYVESLISPNLDDFDESSP